MGPAVGEIWECASADLVVSRSVRDSALALAEARRAGARKDEFELLTRVLGALGEAMSAGRYVDSHLRWNDFTRSLGEFHAQHDLLLTPTIAHPPLAA